MAIVIKEIILSDTLEKFMEKVNFNFDQLLLAGGGPPGPQGPIGLPGPAGPKGDPGNKWYVGCTATEIAIGTTLYQGDLFLAKGACGGCPGSTWGPLGQVFEYNDFTNQFDDTGLNLRGPTGPTGLAGANLFGTIFEGATSTDAWIAFQENLGPTANFYLLKGDTSYIGGTFGATAVVGGLTAQYSREVFWLGGQRGAQARSEGSIDLQRLPKLVVSPRQNIGTPQTSNDDSADRVGSGIQLGKEPTSYALGGDSAMTNSWSNIFVSDELDLRITNWTVWEDAVIGSAGTNSNAISLESMDALRLVSNGYGMPNWNSSYSIQMGTGRPATEYFKGIDWNVLGGQPTHFDAGGILIGLNSEDNVLGLTSNQLHLAARSTSAIRISGGGEANWEGIVHPSLHLTNESGSLNPANGTYTIVMDHAEDPFVDGVLNRSTSTYITSGMVTDPIGITGSYIGLGNVPLGPTYNPVLNAVGSLTGTKRGVNIGLVSSIDLPWHNNWNGSLDVIGRIRMRDSSVATGYVMTDDDGTGTGIWTDPLTIGAWINDTGCDSRIIIGNTDRFASTYNSDVLSYSRFDIAHFKINNNSVADLAFVNYDTIQATNDYSISLDYQDADELGQLSFMRYDEMVACPPSINARDASGSSRAMAIDGYHHIVIGGNTPGQASGSPSGVNAAENVALRAIGIDDNGGSLGQVVPGSITLESVQLVGSNAFNYQYPRIQLSNSTDHNVHVGTGINSPGGWDDQINLEVLRNGNSNGVHNIRFIGTRTSDTTQNRIFTYDIGNNNTGNGVGASGGAYASLISDLAGQTSQYGDQGKSHTGYSFNSFDMFVDRIRMGWNAQYGQGGTNPVGNRTDNSNVFRSDILTMKQWGDASCDWSTAGNGSKGVGEFRFNGSITSTRIPRLESPIRYDYRRNYDLSNGFDANSAPQNTPSPFDPDSAGYGNQFSNHVINWLSPNAEVRVVPINVDRTNTYYSSGLCNFTFNIPMGFLFENNTSPENGSDIQSGGYGAPVYGPGSCGSGASNVATSAGVGTELIPTSGPKSWVRLQNLRIQIPNCIGPAMLDEMGLPSRSHSYNDGQNTPNGGQGGGRTQAIIQSQWFPAACSPIQYSDMSGSLGKSYLWDESTSAAQKYYPLGRNINAWYDHSTGAKSGFNNESKYTRPFRGDSNPTAGWATPIPTHIDGSSSEWSFLPDVAADYSKIHQQQTFFWRVVQKRTSPPLTTGPYTPSGTYIEIVFAATEPTSPFDILNSSNASPPYNRFYKYAETNSNDNPDADNINAFGMPIITPVMAKSYEIQASGNIAVNTCAMIADTKRHLNFYRSHGINFSGSANIVWTTHILPEVVFDELETEPPRDPVEGGGGEQEGQGVQNNFGA